jgi:hypothetical protein
MMIKYMFNLILLKCLYFMYDLTSLSRAVLKNLISDAKINFMRTAGYTLSELFS